LDENALVERQFVIRREPAVKRELVDAGPQTPTPTKFFLVYASLWPRAMRVSAVNTV
jgi:hypothetical protein